MSILLNNLKKILILYCSCYFLDSNSQVVTTVAGNTAGFLDGTGTAALFNGPAGVAQGSDGMLYVADRLNNSIRKIGPDGVVTTLAGNGMQGNLDGIGTAASFNRPMNLCIDAAGTVFVADSGNHRIRKITAAGVVTTVAGSTQGYLDAIGTSAQFSYPEGVYATDSGILYVSDTGNSRIRLISADGMVTTLAGGGTFGFVNGLGTAARFNSPVGILADPSGNVFVAEKGNYCIRKITPNGMVSTFSGIGVTGFADGPGTTAKFTSLYGLTRDAAGNLYVADLWNNRIRKISPDAVVSTLAGSSQGYLDGIGTAARFSYPIGVFTTPEGNVFVGESGNHHIRKITTTLASENYNFEEALLVYPNPTTSIVHLDFVDLTASKIMLSDINGRILYSEYKTENKTILNMENLINGIYLLQIITEKGTTCKKLIKQ